MSDFSTSGTLRIELDRRSLRSAKKELEDELGGHTVSVSTGGAMPDGGRGRSTRRGMGGRAGRQMRRTFRLDQTRTELLEEAVIYLEEIEDHLADGIGGDSYIDDLLGGVVETGGEAGGTAALSSAAAALSGAAGALSGSAAAHTGAAAAHSGAAAALTAAATALGTSGGGPVSVERPSWLPLPVEAPSPIPVESLPGPIPIAPPPGPYPIETPPGPYPIESPPGPYPLEEPPKPYPVEDVEPLEVEDATITVEVEGRQMPERDVDPTGGLRPGTGGTGSREGGDAPSMLGMMNEGMAKGGPFGALVGASGYAARQIKPGLDAGPIVSGEEPSLVGALGGAGTVLAGGQKQTRQGGTTTTTSTRSPTIDVDVSSRQNVVVEPDAGDVADEVADTVADEVQDDIDDLEKEVRDAMDRLDSLENALHRKR